MRKFIAIAAAALTFGSAMAMTAPVEAKEWRRPGVSQQHYNGGKQYYGNRNVRGNYYGNRYRGGNYYGYGYNRGSNGGAVAAGVLGGLAVGALVAGAANQQAYAGDSPQAYCAQRFRSYDPRSGTYLANNGYRYACP